MVILHQSILAVLIQTVNCLIVVLCEGMKWFIHDRKSLLLLTLDLCFFC